MTKTIVLCVCVSLCLWLCAVRTTAKLNGNNPRYTNVWSVNIPGGEDTARRVARDLAFTYKGELGQFKDYYELVREDHPEVCPRHSEHVTSRLLELDQVKWANQQMLVSPALHGAPRPKHSYYQDVQDLLFAYLKNAKNKLSKSRYGKRIFSSIRLSPIYLAYLRRYGQSHISTLGTFSTKPAPKAQLEGYSKQVTKPIRLLSRKLSAYALEYNDPQWRKQWYLQDYRTTDMPVMDLNVVPVHKMGYTGKNVVVGVVDNGVEHDNPEIKDNFLEKLSYDTCRGRPGSWPEGHSHGTYCAGVIAMAPNNNLCGVGIAYDASIVGLRAICNGEQSNAATANALRLHQDKIHIYSNSWGSNSAGRYVFALDHLEQEAYRLGATEGRGGKGVIFVRAAGNDRNKGDNCAVDPDINIPYVITIAGADQFGKVAYYSERCTAVFATAYTRSTHSTEGIVAPELKGGYTTTFDGTSAACPQVSGVIALVLQANGDLSYRDVMHIIAMGAEVAPLADNRDTWYKNGRGFWVSNDFGFGLVNAENLVNIALTWDNVPKLRDCVIDVTLEKEALLSPQEGVDIALVTSPCKGSATDEVNYLEHVELASIVQYPYRGDVMVFLTSPSGTTSQLLETRAKDNDEDGLEGWGIISTHNWGEKSRGKWTVHYRAKSTGYSYHGYVKSFTIKFYGTKEMPAHYKQKRRYAAFRLPDGQTDY